MSYATGRQHGGGADRSSIREGPEDATGGGGAHARRGGYVPRVGFHGWGEVCVAPPSRRPSRLETSPPAPPLRLRSCIKTATEILTVNSTARAENGCAHLQRDMERWTERFPLSVQLADATCHAWAAGSRARDGDAGVGTGDAPV